VRDAKTQRKAIKEKIKRLRKTPGVLRARAQLLQMSTLMPELLHQHPDLDLFAGTRAQGISVSSIDEYDNVQLLGQHHQGGRDANRAQLFKAVLNVSKLPTAAEASTESKTDPLAELIKKMLGAGSSNMDIYRACRSQGYKPANVARVIQRVKFSQAPKTASAQTSDEKKQISKKLCALKRFGLGLQNLKPLRRAVHVLSSVKHRNIVPLEGMCRDEEQRWMLQMPMYASDMKAWAQREFKKAQEAKSHVTSVRGSGMKDATPMEAYHARVAKMLRGVLEGLQFLHHAGIVHRDLKPSNILVGPPVEFEEATKREMRDPNTEYAVITDFDTCKVEKRVSGLTESDTKMQGTRGYMDPQVLDGTFLPSPKSDMFSFGITLAEILLGCTKSIKSVRDVAPLVKNGLLTEPQAQLLTALLRPLSATGDVKPAKVNRRRPTAFQVLMHPFFSRPAELLKRTCCLCGAKVGLSECITCANADYSGDGKKCDQRNHSTCHSCFNPFVAANSKDSETAKFIARRGFVGCPLSYGGASAKCDFMRFPDVEVAAHTDAKTFDLYLAAKSLLAEIKVTRKLSKEFKTKLLKEMEIFKKLGAKKREIHQARAHIIDNILLCVGGDSSKPPTHKDHYGPWALDPCPRCNVGFTDFTGCFAVTCQECGCGFCGWCLADCGDDAHPHVLRCPHNKKRGGYWGTVEQYNQAKNGRITAKLHSYLNRKSQIAREVVTSISVGLRKLGFGHIVQEYAPGGGGGGACNNDAYVARSLLQEEADALA
jgi:serine/threonine protein kinase